jgi:hypothetical protein
MAFGDANNDGHLDLARFKFSSGISTQLGDGSILALQHFAVNVNAWAIGDVNNDGQLDLIGSERNSVLVLLNFVNTR